jgi:hypothetical protein
LTAPWSCWNAPDPPFLPIPPPGSVSLLSRPRARLNLAAFTSDEDTPCLRTTGAPPRDAPSRWIRSWPSSSTPLHPTTCFPRSSHGRASPPSLGNACNLWICLWV